MGTRELDRKGTVSLGWYAVILIFLVLGSGWLLGRVLSLQSRLAIQEDESARLYAELYPGFQAAFRAVAPTPDLDPDQHTHDFEAGLTIAWVGCKTIMRAAAVNGMDAYDRGEAGDRYADQALDAARGIWAGLQCFDNWLERWGTGR